MKKQHYLLLFISIILITSNSINLMSEGNSDELDVIQLGLNDQSREVRSLAIEAILQIGSQDYIPILRDMLDDNNDFVSIKAAEALYKLGDDSGLPVLVNILDTKPELSEEAAPLERARAIAKNTLRVQAATVLGDIRDKGAITILNKNLDDNDGRVVDACLVALAKLGDKTVKEDFVSALRSTKYQVRAKAAEALGDMGDPTVAPAIRERLKDWNREPKVEACIALGKLDDLESIPQIRELLMDEDAIVRENAALSLGMFSFKENKSIKALLDILDDPNGLVRIAASKSLFILGDDSGKEFVLGVLKSDERDAKIKALEALEAMANQGDIKDLESLLDDEDKSIAVRAAKVLVMVKQRMESDKEMIEGKKSKKKDKKKK
ncbi:MAG: HEAT repeat domain-containing protein [Endomicrobiales bacterium]|nr:HEAT repeat domain-containing protein [Endomicrobiales bacterium]